MVKQWLSFRSLLSIISYPSGRASRTEYWIALLITFVALGIALAVVFGLVGLIGLFAWTLFLPIPVYWYSVVVRRMHDLNQTAWNLLWFIPLSFVPVLGFGPVVRLGLKQGSDDDNYYGHSPRYR